MDKFWGKSHSSQQEIAVADPESRVGGFLSCLRAKHTENFLPTTPTFPKPHSNLYASNANDRLQHEDWFCRRQTVGTKTHWAQEV